MSLEETLSTINRYNALKVFSECRFYCPAYYLCIKAGSNSYKKCLEQIKAWLSSEVTDD